MHHEISYLWLNMKVSCLVLLLPIWISKTKDFIYHQSQVSMLSGISHFTRILSCVIWILRFISFVQALDCECIQSSWRGPSIHSRLSNWNIFCYTHSKILCFPSHQQSKKKKRIEEKYGFIVLLYGFEWLECQIYLFCMQVRSFGGEKRQMSMFGDQVRHLPHVDIMCVD